MDKASSFSKELARLQFFGAGPKLAGVPTEKQTRDKTRGVKLNFEYDPVSYKEFYNPTMFSLQFRALKDVILSEKKNTYHSVSGC